MALSSSSHEKNTPYSPSKYANQTPNHPTPPPQQRFHMYLDFSRLHNKSLKIHVELRYEIEHHETIKSRILNGLDHEGSTKAKKLDLL